MLKKLISLSWIIYENPYTMREDRYYKMELIKRVRSMAYLP